MSPKASNPELHIAIVGCGYWGSKHARVLNALEGIGEVLLVDSREDRLRSLARSYRNALCFTSLADALPLADAVVVATPPTVMVTVGATVTGVQLLDG